MKTVRKFAGTVDVDSGQMMLTDPCYVHDFKDGKDQSIYDPELTGTYSYAGACQATLKAEPFGQLNHSKGHAGAAVVTSSGWGDGSYPVYVEVVDNPDDKWDHGRIASMTVVFMSDEEEEASD